MYAVWRQEAKLWQHTRRLVFSIIHGTPNERISALNKPAHIYLINPEGLAWLRQVFGRNDWPFDMLVVDESSMFKTPRAKRFRALRTGLRNFKRRIIMTGTPTPNGMVDLWSQMYLVDRGFSLGTRFTDYKLNHFHRTGFKGYKLEPNEGALEAITNSIAPRVVRLDADDWLKLPPVIDDPIWVDLPQDALKIYRRAERAMFLRFENEELEIKSAASLTNVCSQIANGALWTRENEDGVEYEDRKKTWVPIHDAKLYALREIVDDLQGECPLIAYRFQHDLERIRSMFPKYSVLGKGSSPKATARINEMWDRGKVPGIIAHPMSAGHGLNLQKGGRHIIWFGITWSLEQYQQFIKRLHRGTITQSVINYLILARGTTDMAILEAIDHKDAGQRAVHNALRSYYQKHTAPMLEAA